MDSYNDDFEKSFYEKPTPISLVNKPAIQVVDDKRQPILDQPIKVELSEEAKEELNKQRIKTVFDEAKNSLLEDVNEVDHTLRQNEDLIICEFIYDWDIFNKNYVIRKDEIKRALEFYLEYYDQVERIKQNKIQNVFLRKIRKLYKKAKAAVRSNK